MKYLYIFFGNAFLSVLLFIYLFFSFNGSFPLLSKYALAYAAVIVLGNAIGFSIWYLNKWINRFWLWKKTPVIKIIVLTVCFTALAVILAQISFSLISTWYFNYITDSFSTTNDINLRLKFAILSFNLMLVYVLTDNLLFSYKNYIYRKVDLVKEQKERSQLQLEMLQKQLSPHYLFNSLNTISSLLETSAKTSEKYIRKLVNTYRYILSISNKELVTLKQELKMIRAYQFQLEVRFGANIKWFYSIDENLESWYLPPLSLQILVENAVKHNVASNKKALEIHILATNNFLFVKNNITESSEKMISHKIGLKNLQRRYQLLGSYKIRIQKDDYFQVQLPLIEIE